MADFHGTDGDDNPLATAGDDFFFLSRGNDTLDGLGGNDWVIGEPGVDGIEVDLGAGTALYDGFTQVLRNIENADISGDGARLTGSDGANDLVTYGDNTFISGGAGNDTLTAWGGAAQLQGGAGNDFMSVYGDGASTFRGGDGNDLVGLDAHLAEFTLGYFADGLRLTSTRQTLDIMDDVETIEFIYDDTDYTYAQLLAMAGGPINGTPGDDVLYGTNGDDMINGLGGNDWILPGGVGNDTVDGGDGWDMVSFAGFGTGIMVRLYGTHSEIMTRQIAATTTEISNIEGITGTSHSDAFYGSAGNDHFRGLGGADWFAGGAGADYFAGGAGNDTLDYNFGSSSGPGVYASLLRGRGWTGEAAGDRFTDVENIRGGFGNDRLDGDHGANRLEGGYGDDTLTGMGGDDVLYGGHGTDVAVYFGNQADYQILRNGFRTDVTHLNGGWEGHDILAHVDILRFADGDLIL